MRVVIVGAGNVATVFGRLMVASGHVIIQVVSRTIASAQSLAIELGCSFSDNLSALDQTADIYILAITDQALQQIQGSIFLGDKLIVHTAGSVSKQVLSTISTQFGVIYPLQSLRKEQIGGQPKIPLLIDANNPSVLSVIEKFAFSLSSIVSKVEDEQRFYLHLAAVIVNNFTNHLYSLTAEYCKNEGVDFKMLQPIIEETALRLKTRLPSDVQTGPAIREDRSTLERHLLALSNHPELKIMYQTFTESLLKIRNR
jgi:predicted short-subunit dehydrogenase-like oxidoreductase (DUF2520 family)